MKIRAFFRKLFDHDDHKFRIAWSIRSMMNPLCSMELKRDKSASSLILKRIKMKLKFSFAKTVLERTTRLNRYTELFILSSVIIVFLIGLRNVLFPPYNVFFGGDAEQWYG